MKAPSMSKIWLKTHWPGSFPSLELEALVQEVEDGQSLEDNPPAGAFSSSLPQLPLEPPSAPA